MRDRFYLNDANTEYIKLTRVSDSRRSDFQKLSFVRRWQILENGSPVVNHLLRLYLNPSASSVSSPSLCLLCSSSSSSAASTYLGVRFPCCNSRVEERSSTLCTSSSELQLGDDPEGSVVELEEETFASGTESFIPSANAAKSPTLSIKEKKKLASYAHSLGRKLKCQQVGKSGVTLAVAASFLETLEANELLKLKVHNNHPGELADVVKQLEEATGSVTVGQIGRTVILYRPSLTKLKAEEKKKQA